MISNFKHHNPRKSRLIREPACSRAPNRPVLAFLAHGALPALDTFGIRLWQLCQNRDFSATNLETVILSCISDGLGKA